MDFEIKKSADGSLYVEIPTLPSDATSLQSDYQIGEQWFIEEDAPRWPDGRRMYREDEEELVNCVREAFAQSATPSVFELREQLDLSNSLVDALVKSGVEKTVHDASFEHFSLIFLAGVAWQNDAQQRQSKAPYTSGRAVQALL